MGRPQFGKARRPASVDDGTAFGRRANPMNYMLASFRLLFKFFGVILCLVFILQCRHKKSQSSSNYPAVSPASKGINVRYARGFSIDAHENYTLIKVFNPFQDHSDTLRYVLVPRRNNLPENYPARAQVIRTPVRSIIVTSTTHIALTEMLQANKVIKGMVGAKYAYSKEIRRRLATGKIIPFNQGEFNNEVALNMNPDLVMISAGQASQYDNYHLLVDSGIAVFANAEWLEKTPLGKAEWLKVMGALLGKQEQANKKFKEIADRYQKLKTRVKQARNAPLVINNMPHRGAWFVSGGNSFTAQFLKDAGANYPWFDNKSTGGLRLDFETVYEAGLRADIWLNPGSAKTKEDISAVDSRFKDFKSYQTDHIYNNNKRMSPKGGNDFWETGVVRPDLVLSDLITIFHPDLMKSDSLYFYQKLK